MNDKGESLQFYTKVFVLSIPIALQSLITIGVNMLDTMMVASLGDEALSATSLANSFISVFQCFSDTVHGTGNGSISTGI